MILQELKSKELVNCPDWIPSNTHYLTIMGSVAYGVSSDTSDMDVYGFCIPKKDMIFPHLRGIIPGFGRQQQRFDQWQQHHIFDKDSSQEFDFSVYSIVRFFDLCMENNPNMIDSLFTPRRCVLHTTQVGEIVRENRKMFLHKGGWSKFKGYSFSQLHKMKSKKIKEFIEFCQKKDISTATRKDDIPNLNLNEEDSKRLRHLIKEITKDGEVTKRLASVEEHGYDLKFAYHVVRLLGEIEQIMIEGDLDLEKNREQLKSIRRGEWTQERITQYFEDKERQLEEVYLNSKLDYSPNEGKIKQLLLNCLESHFGNLDKAIVIADKYEEGMREIQEILKRVGL